LLELSPSHNRLAEVLREIEQLTLLFHNKWRDLSWSVHYNYRSQRWKTRGVGVPRFQIPFLSGLRVSFVCTIIPPVCSLCG